MNDETTPTPPPAPDFSEASAPAPVGAIEFDSGATATADRPLAAAKQADAHGWWWATGRRKTAVARVRIKPGSGEYKIQKTRKKFKTIEEYFTEPRDREDAVAPLKATSTHGQMDVIVRIHGGGYMGQAQAVRLAVSRALKGYDPNLEGILRDNGFLTRDPREVERKKYGRAGARKRFQFSKR